MILNSIIKRTVSQFNTVNLTSKFSTIPCLLNSSTLLKKEVSKAIKIELKEEDLRETFVKGSGNGGQAINKTNSNVELVHLPTGIRLQCQKTRSQSENRKIARKMMLQKLDELYNGNQSKKALKIQKLKKQKAKARKRSLEKYSKEESDKAEVEEAQPKEVKIQVD